MLDGRWIAKWAKTYDETHTREQPVEISIRRALEVSPSSLTRQTLAEIELWKWGRRRGLVKENNDEFVKEVSRISFGSKDERLKLEVLTLLKGVEVRMAATILAFRYPQNYSVFDWRAWKSLESLGKIEGKIENTFECWKKYNKVCHGIAEQNGVSLRELDKALWQFKGGR